MRMGNVTWAATGSEAPRARTITTEAGRRRLRIMAVNSSVVQTNPGGRECMRHTDGSLRFERP
jgi:hypothetical protein